MNKTSTFYRFWYLLKIGNMQSLCLKIPSNGMPLSSSVFLYPY